MSGLSIGLDVGGTKVLGGVISRSGDVARRVKLETPQRTSAPAVVEATIGDAVRDLACGSSVASVGIGAAGFVDAAGATVMFSPHLSWRNEPLKEALEQRLGVPVYVDNDANTTARAELKFGAGRGHQQMLCVTLGTGIGGALVLNGEVFRGANGMAGEFGHMQVVEHGRRCECGNRGCWEQYSSGNALVREGRELIAAHSPAAHILRELAGDDPDMLTGPMVTQAAQAGDPAALEMFQEIGAWLGTGLAGLTAAFDPEIIVIGGGVSDAGDLLLDPAREALARKLTGRGFRPEPAVVKAELGPDAGFIGAADMAREALARQQAQG